jgi:hypothetical protein
MSDANTFTISPVWGRIAAAVCAREFEERDLTDTLRQARELLKETEINPIDPGQLARLRAMLPLPDPPTPWESTNNG